MSIRDALVLTSMALDYEKDDYNTPRISAVADRQTNTAWLAIVRDNGLEVRQMPLEPARYFYVATYEENTITLDQSGGYNAANAVDACEFIISKGIFADREKPVTAVAVVAHSGGFDLATKDVTQE